MINLFPASVSTAFSPLSVIRTFWKRKWAITVLWLLGTAASVGVVSRMKPLYSTSSIILVESQQIPESFVHATVQTALEARLDTLKQQVLSHDRLWNIITTLNLYPEERRRLPKEEVLGLMRDDIAIELVRGWSARRPGAFKVEYTAPKPELAADVANRVGMFFINENLRQRTVEAAGTAEFLESQLAQAESRLQTQEARLKEFKLTYNGELPQQEAALLAALGQSRTELLGIQEALSRAQQNKLILEGSLSYAQTALRERQEFARQQSARGAALLAQITRRDQPLPPTELERAQSYLEAQRVRYHDAHPEVQRAIREVERLTREAEARAQAHRQASSTQSVSTEGNAAPVASAASDSFQAENDRIRELTSQLAVVQQEIDSLERRRQGVIDEAAGIQAHIRNIPVREQQLAAISRDYETGKANYDSLLNKKLAADVATDMERWAKSQRFVMLDPAPIPQRPARPRKTLLIGGGSAFTLIIAAALAFAFELRRNVFLGEWELPEGLVVLGRIPLVR